MNKTVLVFGITSGETPKYLNKFTDLVDLKIIDLEILSSSEMPDSSLYSGMLFLDQPNSQNIYDSIFHNDTEFSRLKDYLQIVLKQNRPVLALGKGMYFLNDSLSNLEHQQYENNTISDELIDVFISPGSKTAAIIGSGGFFKIPNTLPLSMKEFQRSNNLITSIYQLGTGHVQGIESTLHDWVLGYQFNPFIDGPSIVRALIDGFIERALD